MTWYFDSSVVLRKVLRQSNALSELDQVSHVVSSVLGRVECFRTLDRYRLRGDRGQETMLESRIRAQTMFRRIGLLPLSDYILSQAEQSMIIPLGSLDCIHLMTALVWRDQNDEELIFATHDKELSLAAQSYGLQVVGV